jgi:hypothetical protein
MGAYTLGSARLPLAQDELATYQGNGSVSLDSRRPLTLWFNGRFLTARDLAREQDYFLQRQADLAQAAGFGVVHGLWVDTPSASDPGADAETVIIRAGQGTTPAGELVLLPNDLTAHLSDIPDEENLDVQFGLSSMPDTPLRTRTGVYVLGLRPVEFTANPIASYPTTLQGTRTTHDGDIVEATAITLVPYPDPLGWSGGSAQDASMRRAAIARQIFVTGNAPRQPDQILPLALISLQRGAIEWVDPYLVRRDTGPEYSGLRLGLTDPATQRACLLQYSALLQEIIATRRTSGLSASFAASTYLQALPPGGTFPLASISITNQTSGVVFSQVFFPPQMDVRLSVVPFDEIPALIEESLTMPAIDLTLSANSYADLSVFALIPVPRSGFAALKRQLPVLAPNPALPQILGFRTPFQLLQLYKGAMPIIQPSAPANAAWANAIGNQTYGFYIRRRSSPTFVDFTTSPTS